MAKNQLLCFNVSVNERPDFLKIYYQLTANFVFLIHFILVCIVTVGWLIPQLFYLHITLLLAILFSEVIFGYCPLTRMEYALRHKLDPTILFDKSCMVHYLRKWRGLPPRPTPTTNATFFKKNSFLFILIGLGILSFLYKIFLG